MSGVGEALAIVSCVAGLIQAYDAASRRIEKIKKSRAQRQAPPPPVDLETSVERGKHQIVEVVKEGRERFGNEFEHGDGGSKKHTRKTVLTLNRGGPDGDVEDNGSDAGRTARSPCSRKGR
jgi:hypothetical protein